MNAWCVRIGRTGDIYPPGMRAGAVFLSRSRFLFLCGWSPGAARRLYSSLPRWYQFVEWNAKHGGRADLRRYQKI